MSKIRSTMMGAMLCALVACGSAVQAADPSDWGMAKGDWEFTLGGGGASSSDFDANAGSFNASVGYYLSRHIEVALRQNLSFAIGDDGDAIAGQTRVAGDYHFVLGERFRPYVGVNIGGMYGDGVNDSFAAGLEAGLKYYVKPKTFIFGHFEYAWAFDSGDEFDDSFDDGSFIYAVGVGFNF